MAPDGTLKPSSRSSQVCAVLRGGRCPESPGPVTRGARRDWGRGLLRLGRCVGSRDDLRPAAVGRLAKREEKHTQGLGVTDEFGMVGGVALRFLTDRRHLEM